MAASDRKLIEAKRRQLERFKESGPTVDPASARMPPGQHLTRKFPVLDLGVRPPMDTSRWRLVVEGEVASPLTLDWQKFLTLQKRQEIADFHCVTTWSKYDVQWGGVKFLDLAATVRPTVNAGYVIAHGADGYTTNLPLEECLRDDVMLAYELFGESLSLEHGGPVRLVVPRLYAWKSAKFLRRLVFSATDDPGYWETRGYHNRGNPWLEERYG